MAEHRQVMNSDLYCVQLLPFYLFYEFLDFHFLDFCKRSFGNSKVLLFRVSKKIAKQIIKVYLVIDLFQKSPDFAIGFFPNLNLIQSYLLQFVQKKDRLN